MLIGQQQPGTWDIDELIFPNWRRVIVILFSSVFFRSWITKDSEGKVVLDRAVVDLLDKTYLPVYYKKNIKTTTNKYLKTSLTTIYA